MDLLIRRHLSGKTFQQPITALLWLKMPSSETKYFTYIAEDVVVVLGLFLPTTTINGC